MPALNEHFLTEATDFMRGLDRSLERVVPDIAELHRATRGLRGTAQMARDDRIYRAASSFENATRALVHGRLAWSEDVALRARATAADLRVLLEGTEDEAQLEARADAAAARWSGSAAAHSAAEAGAQAGREFREFAAREVAGIADVLERGLQELIADPMNREPLRAVLRRQRALLGSARLDEIGVVAEILRALEDLTGVIARLDVGVKKEWLDVYRVAREGLRATIDPLRRGENPEPTHALSRLRHMRAELLERYGKGDPPAAASEETLFRTPDTRAAPDAPPGAQPARAASPTPAPSASRPLAAPPATSAGAPATAASTPRPAVGAPPNAAPATGPLRSPPSSVAPTRVPPAPPEAARPASAAPAQQPVPPIVPIEELGYSPQAALRRALELSQSLHRAVSHDREAAEAVDELFDLIRLALE